MSEPELEVGEKPATLTPIVQRERRGLRLSHLMYAVGVSALVLWLFSIGTLFVVVGSIVLLVGGAIALGVVLGRRTSTQRESLLWALAIASEQSMPLSPAALAFADQYGRGYRWRSQFLAALLDEGKTLPEAVDEVPGLMTRDATALVRVGWESGTLPRALRDAAELDAARQTSIGEIASRLTYVVSLLISIQMIIGFLMYFIMPKFEAIFRDFGVPLPSATIFVIKASHFFIDTGGVLWALLIVALELAILFFLMFGALDRYTVDVPFLDFLFRRRHTALLLRALALAVEGGKPMSDALVLLGDEYPSGWVRRRLRSAERAVRSGSDWVEALHRRRLINRSDAAILASAQRVGNLAWALREVATSADRRYVYRLQFWVDALFPIALVFVGLLVFAMATAYFMPLVVLIERLAG